MDFVLNLESVWNKNVRKAHSNNLLGRAHCMECHNSRTKLFYLLVTVIVMVAKSYFVTTLPWVGLFIKTLGLSLIHI